MRIEKKEKKVSDVLTTAQLKTKVTVSRWQ